MDHVSRDLCIEGCSSYIRYSSTERYVEK